MDASKTDSLQVPWDNSEEHSDLKTTKWEGKMKNIAVCGFCVLGDGNNELHRLD